MRDIYNTDLKQKNVSKNFFTTENVRLLENEFLRAFCIVTNYFVTGMGSLVVCCVFHQLCWWGRQVKTPGVCLLANYMSTFSVCNFSCITFFTSGV